MCDDKFLPDNIQDLSQSEVPPPAAVNMSSQELFEDSMSSRPGSLTRTLPLMNQQFTMSGHLTPEEAADHLELPEGGNGLYSQERNSGRNKDTYYFYQGA